MTVWKSGCIFWCWSTGVCFLLSQVCFKLNNPSSLNLSSQDFSSQIFWQPFAELGLVYPFLSCTWRTNTWQSTPACIITHRGKWRVIIPSVSCSCYYSPGYFSSSLLPGCCCLMLIPSGVFSAEPLPMHQFPACIVARTISFKFRVLLFPLLNFVRILSACSSNLYRPFYMTALSCSVSIVSPSLEWKCTPLSQKPADHWWVC